MTGDDLRARIQSAQILAGERAVVESLHDRGICPESCEICKENADSISHSWSTRKRMGYDNPVSLETTLENRGQEYGEYSEMARIAQRLKETMRSGPSWVNMSPVQRESLEMHATKLARIVCGNPNNPDSWRDIAGYAKLAEDRLPQEQSRET